MLESFYYIIIFLNLIILLIKLFFNVFISKPKQKIKEKLIECRNYSINGFQTFYEIFIILFRSSKKNNFQTN